MWIADSYAKINLGLNVLERLPVGKLNIETGLCFIDWRDRFEVKRADEMKVEVDQAEQPAESAQHIENAIKALNRYVELENSYRFHIEKRIPVGAGLGSGGSNAALTLKMLNKMEDLGLSNEELNDLGRDLSDDIGFFLNETPGVYRGNGQPVELLDIQPDLWTVTCYPNEEAEAIGAYTRDQINPDANHELQAVLAGEEPFEWRYMLSNDLEQPVFQQNPVSGNLKDQFYEFGAVYAAMAGRGPAVFGLFEQNFVAVDAYKTLLNLGYPANLTKPGFTPDFGIYRKK